MKTKCLVGILLVLFIASFISCSDDDNQNDKDKLPETAQAFIESRLPGYNILNIKEVDDNEDELNEKYIVTFSNDVLVSFSSLGYWRRIKSSSELPELLLEVIPFNGVAKIENRYPMVTINEINHTLYGYQVVTSHGTPFAFYDINNSDTFGLDITREPNRWPENADLFIEAFFLSAKNQPYFFVKDKDGSDSGYRFGLQNGLRVYFDKKGDWHKFDSGSWSMDNKLYQALLPQEIRDIIEQKHKAKANMVYALLRYENYYQVSLKCADNVSIPILFDTITNQEVEPSTDAILDFLKTYVGEPAEDLAINMQMVSDSKQVAFHYTGKGNGVKVFTMHTDVEGEMLHLDLNGSIIPDKILDYLPEKVKEHAEKNHVGKEIVIVVNGLEEEYCILYKDGSRLYYDKDGNVIN